MATKTAPKKRITKKKTTFEPTPIKKVEDVKPSKPIKPIKTVNAWELESHQLPTRPGADEVSYKFVSEHGTMYVRRRRR